MQLMMQDILQVLNRELLMLMQRLALKHVQVNNVEAMGVLELAAHVYRRRLVHQAVNA
jgi:hypothetical protein